MKHFQLKPVQMANFIFVPLLLLVLFSCRSCLQIVEDSASDSDTTIPTKPVITTAPTDIFSSDGVLEFTCQARGYPKPVVTWHDAVTGEAVIDRIPHGGATSGIHVNQHYGKLLISNPLKNKTYTFYCNASNSVGWTISEPPVRGGLAYLMSQFRQVPLDKTVHEGDRVLIECVAPEGVPEPKVFWTKNKQLIAVQRGARIPANLSLTQLSSDNEVSTDGSLQIHSVRISDAGSYVCVANNAAGEQISPAAQLTVKSRARFLEVPSDARVKKGSDVKFRCRVEGNHIVQWRRGPGEAMIDPSRAELTENYLLLKKVQPSDAGTYICTAPGAIEANAELTVDTPPAFSRTPDDVTVTVGETAIFHCSTIGHPLPGMYWELPDKTPIFPGDQSSTALHTSRHILHGDGSLEIRNVEPQDAGKYQCTAHSSIDTIHTSAILHVIPLNPRKSSVSEDPYLPPKNMVPDLGHPIDDYPGQSFYHFAPIIGLPPANQTRSVGDVVTLDCELGTTQEPSMQPPNEAHYSHLGESAEAEWSVGWQRSTLTTGAGYENLDSFFLAHEQRFSLLQGGSLQILDVQPEDAGNYTCVAKAYFNSETNNMQTVLQSNWTSHLNVVSKNSIVSKPTENENPLSPPRNLRVTNLTATTVTLVWDPSNWDPSYSSLSASQLISQNLIDSPKVTYWVELYRPDQASDGWLIVERNWHVNTVQLGGLQPNTPYYFLIRPRWNQGRVGWASAPLGPIVTLKLPPKKSQPTSNLKKALLNRETAQNVRDIEINTLRVFALSSRRVRVSWSVMDFPHILALITGYKIHYREVPLMRCISSKFGHLYLEPQEKEPKNVDGAYCSIQLGTSGESQTIPDILHRMETMQKLHQEFQVLQGQLNVNSTSIFGFTSDIKANYHVDDSHSDQQHPSAYQESGLLRDLEPFRCYEVKIKAYSTSPLFGHIEGRESISRTVLTYESFPSAPPEKMYATWISNSTVELSWNAPLITAWNGFLMGYIIYVYDEKAHSHQNFNVSYPQSKTLIKGLSESKVYLIQMAAVTCKGIGVRSEPLRLLPELRKKGLGVGWGFDDETGKSLSLVETEQNEEIDDNYYLLRQPWFITTIVLGLFMWCGICVLLIICCRRQRYVFRKAAGAVLIANTSQCGSAGDGTSGIHTIGNDVSLSKNRHFNEKDQLQLEPLIKNNSSSSETDTRFNASNTGTFRMKRQPFNQANNSKQGFYAVTTNTCDQLNLNQENCESSFNSFHPTLITLPICLTSTQPTSPGLYATAENPMNDFHVQLNQNNLAGPMDVGHLMYPNVNGHPHYPNPQAVYLTYQGNLIPQTQTSNFGNVNMNYDPSKPQLGRLPLIAPVAQLDSIQAVGNPHMSQSSVIDSAGSSLSVAPYASVSIVPSNNVTNDISGPSRVFKERRSNERSSGTCFLPISNTLIEESQNADSQSTYESGDVLSSELNAHNALMNGFPNRVGYLCQPLEVETSRIDSSHSHLNNNGNMLCQDSECYNPNRQNTTRSKSASTNSGSLTNDEDRIQRWKKSTTESSSGGSGSMSNGSFTISTNPFIQMPTTTSTSMANATVSATKFPLSHSVGGDELVDKQLLVYVNGMIPPPPESPPPPAPEIQSVPPKYSYPQNSKDYYHSPDSSNFSPNSENSNEISNREPVSLDATTNGAFMNMSSGKNKNSMYSQSHIYDSNFDSNEDDDLSVPGAAQDNFSQRKNQSVNHKPTSNHTENPVSNYFHSTHNENRPLSRSNRLNDQQDQTTSSFYMGLSSDEPSNSTYAQVY